MAIADTLLPVFLILILGWALAARGFLTGPFLAGLDRLAYWVGLPAFVFRSVAVADFGSGTTGAFTVLLAGTLGAAALGLAVALAMRLNSAQIGSFFQAGLRGNLAYVGLPVVAYAFAGQGDGSPALRNAVLALAPTMILYNVLSVIGFEACRHRLSFDALRRVGRQVVRNPLIIASAAGWIFALLPATLPTAIDRTFLAVGQMALPLALISIGGAIASTPLREALRPALAAAFVKTFAAPAIGLAIGLWLKIGGDELRVGALMLACPTAAASYVMAAQLGGDTKLASSAIALSTILSAASLALILAFV
jgi:malate permease and related proteins